MNELIRQYVRKIIIAEMRRKAPLLNFDDIEDELTEPLDIDKNTKVPTELNSFYEDDDDEDEFDDEDLDIEDVSDFYSETEEDSESYTVENPLPKAAYDPSFRIRDDSVVSGDPMRRKPPEIQRDVHAIADELEGGIDKSKKSESQREAEFLKRMEDMIAQNASPERFPTDPEFASISSEDTLELPADRPKRSIPSFLSDEEDTRDLSETVNDFVRSSMLKKFNNN